MAELEDQLRAAREVIAVLQRRLERETQHRDVDSSAAHRAIASLENTVDLRTRELAASEAHYRALFDHGPNSTFIVDEHGAIVRANAAARRAFGPEGGELAGRSLASLFEAEAREAVEALLAAGEGEVHELTIDDRCVADLSAAQVPGFGHTQLILRDVSARVELDRELQHARRLAAIGHLAAGVAHEINNPLAVLLLGLEHLRESADDPARVDELLTHAERIARIVANLRTFANPRPPERSAALVTSLVDAATKLASRALEGVELHVDIKPPGLAVDVDRLQIEQVLTNLLTNAGRVLRGRGSIAIQARLTREGSRVLLRVQDSGPGIPEAMLEQIFAPFVSEDERAGMGLGLAISWGLVKENRGSIRAFNQPGGGACFEVDLPRAGPRLVADPEPEADPAAPEDGPKLRILCVEDEDGLRRSLLHLLRASGHEPTGVASAEAGVEALGEQDFDLVISDVRLPGEGGEWLRRYIQERHPELAGRVLLMSGYFPAEDAHGHFLQKPFKLGQLQAAIAAVLEEA